MRILFAGTPNVAITTLEWLNSSKHELVGVLTRPAAAQGRSNELVDSPVANFAKDNSIKTYTSFESLLTERILESIDLVVVIAYGKLIPNELLQLPKYGWVNIHFSLLPKFRGAAPVQRAIWSGEKSSGISIFQLDKGMDTGPIFTQKTFEIGDRETSGECLERVSQLVPEMLDETLSGIENSTIPTPQDDSKATFAPKIDKSELRIDWNTTASSIKNMVRALNPTPRAKTTFRKDDLFIYETQVSDTKSSRPAGTLIFTSQNLYVATNDFDLEILKVQSSGKKIMSGSEWSRGIQSKDDATENRYV